MTSPQRESTSLRILIVDDSPESRRNIEKIVEMHGYTVAGTAPDGEMGFDLAKSLRPDVVLMDLQMPKMNGIEATRQIQSVCPVPVVVVTTYVSKEIIAECAEAGAGAYVQKRHLPDELGAAITIAKARFDDMMKLRDLNRALENRRQELVAALLQIKDLKEQARSVNWRLTLVTRFDESELRNLCFDLAVDYESLAGQGLADKARELLLYMERRDRTPELAEMVRRQRPDIEFWNLL